MINLYYIFIVVLALLFALIFSVIEIFVIPGFGLLGFLSFLLFAMAIYLAYTKLGILGSIITFGAGIVSFVIVFIVFSRSKTWKATKLDKKLSSSQGFKIEDKSLRSLIKKSAKALSDLHPVGIVEVDNKRFDAVSEAGSYIESGAEVEVIGINGTRLLVRKKEVC